MERRNTQFEWIGISIPRKEDPRLLSGRGVYIDDVAIPKMAHVAILPSPHAHARIVRIDASKATQLPGVLLIMTGAEIAQHSGPLPCSGVPTPIQYCLAVDRVRHVGEAVAAIVAENRYIAEDAARLIEVEYDPLPVMADPMTAMHAAGDGVLHPDLGSTNVIYNRKFDFGEVKADFAAAELVVRRQLRWPRSSAQALETAGALASYDPIEGSFTIYANTGGYNFYSRRYSAMLGVPGHKINLVPVLAGGSFGSKVALNKVVAIAAVLARACGRPVKYLEDRYDHLANSDTHGCDRVYDAELACKRDGTFLSLRYKVVDDYGAYFQYGVATHANTMAQLTGPYRIKSASAEIIGVLTNKCQQGAYRGMGSEAHNFMLERLVDAAAQELEIDPIEIRERNFIRNDQFPYKIPTGNIYDSGNYQAVLEKARSMFEYDKWRSLQRDALASGKSIGIGIATCQERSVFSATEFWLLDDNPSFPLTSAPESVRLKIDVGGGIIVTLFSPFWGNSPETVAAQFVAEEFSVDPADIVVRYADSANGLMSKGPSGSRFTVMLAGAVKGASAILRSKIYRIAAHLLSASESELEMRSGRVQVVTDPNRSLSLSDVALKAHFFRLSLPADPEITSELSAQYTYDHPLTTLPNADRSDLGIFYPIVGHACHMVALEVNRSTGKVQFLKYVAVHDCGTMVNPESVVGQIIGGIVQGVGSAIYEQLYYDDGGQLLTSTFADYHIPTVYEAPYVEVGHIETPSPYTAYGVKGAGEGGRMVAPAVIASAIEDALRPIDVRIEELPVTCARLRGLIRAHETRILSTT